MNLFIALPGDPLLHNVPVDQLVLNIAIVNPMSWFSLSGNASDEFTDLDIA